MSNPVPIIPICLVTGFLGSGKTTFLKQVIQRHRDQKLVYLINEFSSVDVDGALLKQEAQQVVSIPGGSIFCKCLVTEFIQQLQQIATTWHLPGAPVAGVVIEASGMANPKVMEDMLRETRLDQQYRLARIITLVDPGSFLKLLCTLPNIKAQVEAADLALLNKTDLFPPERLAAVETEIRKLKPGLTIERCVFGQTAVNLFGNAAHPGLHGELAPCRDPHYSSRAIGVKPDTDVHQLEADLRRLADDFYRVKGFIRSGGQCYYLDFNSSALTVTPVADGRQLSELAFILRGQPSPDAQQFLDQLGVTL